MPSPQTTYSEYHRPGVEGQVASEWGKTDYFTGIVDVVAGIPFGRAVSQGLGPGKGILLGSAYKKVTGAVVAAGGAGYANGNTITLNNGVVLTVTAHAAGVITTVSITNPGQVAGSAADPTNPQAQVSTSGSGTGATFTLTWTQSAAEFAGISVSDKTLVSKEGQAIDIYPFDGNCGIMAMGDIWVIAASTATQGTAATFDPLTGQIFAAGAGGKLAIPGSRWLVGATIGLLGLLRLTRGHP